MHTREEEINIDPLSDPSSEWGINMSLFGGTAQSFTAVSHHIRFIGFYVSTSPNIPAVQFQLNLLEGAGVSGSVVGARYATAPVGLYGFLYFDFSGTKLTVGNVYTAVIAQNPPVDAQNGSELLGTENVYPHGTAFTLGKADPSTDCYFRVLHVIYTAQIQPPLKALVPLGEHIRVKFTLAADGVPTCDLPRAKLSLSLIKSSTVLVRANFRKEGCEYIYDLPTEGLTSQMTYKVMILIHDIEAGSVTFTVQ
jgi:hypothetical protein